MDLLILKIQWIKFGFRKEFNNYNIKIEKNVLEITVIYIYCYKRITIDCALFYHYLFTIP